MKEHRKIRRKISNYLPYYIDIFEEVYLCQRNASAEEASKTKIFFQKIMSSCPKWSVFM